MFLTFQSQIPSEIVTGGPSLVITVIVNIKRLIPVKVAKKYPIISIDFLVSENARTVQDNVKRSQNKLHLFN